MTTTDDPPLQGFKYLERVGPLLSRLRNSGHARDRAGNRELHFDRYAALLLLYFFNPALTSLRALQAATSLQKVADATGGRRVSLGSLAEAPAAFDPALLREVLREVAARSLPTEPPADQAALRDLVAVDGSLLHALPRMAWAVWQGPRHRAAKVHVAFEVFRGTPADATLTAGIGPERQQLRDELLRPGRVYVIDRGYESYGLLAAIRAAGSSFVARLQADAAFTVDRERPTDPAAVAAGVMRDVVVARLGVATPPAEHAPGTVRLVFVAGAGTGGPVLLATDRLDWPAEWVALAYRYRWSVELFFRWLKSILGCRHLLSGSADGVAMQVYAALIASVLLAQWTGRKPDKRSFEMFCHYFSGWATEAELDDYLRRRQAKTESSA
jgi:hypothetical protein